MKKILSILIALIIVGGIVYLSWLNRVEAPGNEISATRNFASPLYGVSFTYPTHYFLEEKNIDANHAQILLTEDTEENKAIREGKAPGREGPPAITIDVFKQTQSKQSAAEFINNNPNSNVKLGNGVVSTTTRGALTGLEYTWSGLYEGRSFVVSNAEYIYLFSVTRLAPEDRIVSDFDSLMKTVVIQ